MFIKLLLEGLGLSLILFIICAVGIKSGAVGMVQLYHKDVQDRCVELGLTTHEKIKKRAIAVRLISIPTYLVYVLLCVYLINQSRGFVTGFLHIFAILSVMNLFDRFVIDEFWVGHTNAWTIPGTEDLKPYINGKDKVMKWLMGIVGMAAFATIIAAIMSLILK